MNLLTLTIIAFIFGSRALQNQDRRARIITAIFCLAIWSAWFIVPFISTVAVIVSGLTALITAIIYSKESTKREVKFAVVSGGLLLFLKLIASFFNLPYSMEIQFAMAIPIALYIWFVIEGGYKRSESNFLSLWILLFMDFLI